MSSLSAFAEAEQLNLDDVLAELREEIPPEVTAAAGIPTLVATTEASQGDEIGIEPHNATCPYAQQCDTRRRRLPIYRPYQPCHWVAWGDWQRCPIYRAGGDDGSA